MHWQVHLWTGKSWLVRYPRLFEAVAVNIGQAMVSLGYSVRLYNCRTGDAWKFKTCGRIAP